jgi:hypothetical protein
LSDDWMLWEAFGVEVRRVRRRRRVTIVVAGAVSIGAGLALAGIGQPLLATAALVSGWALILVADRSVRVSQSDPLDCAAALSLWLAERDLIDSEGKLTTQGLSRLAEAQRVPGKVSSGGTPSPESIAVGAYSASVRLAAEGESWIGPMADALGAVDSGEFKRGLDEKVRKRRSAIWWLVVGPLALAGLGLLLLGLVGSLIHAIG